MQQHHARRPAVFRDVLPAPLATPAETFAALRAVAQASPAELRVYERERRVEPREEIAPRQTDRTVAGYMKRLSRHLAEPGVVLNQIQAGSAPLWARTLQLLAPLYARIGMPTDGALLDLFAGSYRRSFLGVHKDDQDVFTFVLSGRKRFLVWPFEALAARAAAPASKRLLPHRLVDADIEQLRGDATVLEAGPRDVIYWPADWWHLAESDGTLAVTLALGIFRRSSPLRLLARTLDELRLGEARVDASTFGYPVDTLPYSAAPEERARGAAVRKAARARVLSSPTFLRREEIVHEAWLSGMGYARLPPRRASFALRASDAIQVTSPAAFRLLDRGDELILCAGGHALPLPAHTRLAALLETLRRGRTHEVHALIRTFERGAGTTERQLAPEVIVHVLSWLGCSHVLTRLSRARHAT